MPIHCRFAESGVVLQGERQKFVQRLSDFLKEAEKQMSTLESGVIEMRARCKALFE
jgi:hypothetical protein